MQMNQGLIGALCFAIVPLFAPHQQPAPVTVLQFLSFDELVALSDTDEPAAPLAAKLDRLLNTPMLNNEASLSGVRPYRPSVDAIGPILLEHREGLNYDLIRLALSDPAGFKQAALQRGGLDTAKQVKIEEQLRMLRDADIVVLNEVDLGMKCTDYRDVAKDLAHALGMNYVFGVEFVEVSQ